MNEHLREEQCDTCKSTVMKLQRGIGHRMDNKTIFLHVDELMLLVDWTPAPSTSSKNETSTLIS